MGTAHRLRLQLNYNLKSGFRQVENQLKISSGSSAGELNEQRHFKMPGYK